MPKMESAIHAVSRTLVSLRTLVPSSAGQRLDTRDSYRRRRLVTALICLNALERLQHSGYARVKGRAGSRVVGRMGSAKELTIGR